jgi:hypothetical protein
MPEKIKPDSSRQPCENTKAPGIIKKLFMLIKEKEVQYPLHLLDPYTLR